MCEKFVSCRGIPVLVRILEDSDYDKNVHLVRMAFECVAGSLDLVVTASKIVYGVSDSP